MEDEILGFDLDESLLEGQPGDSPVDLTAQLDEARFFLEQGLLDEAEGLCREILEKDPACEGAGKISAQIQEFRRKSSTSSMNEGYIDLSAEILAEEEAEAEAAKPKKKSRTDRFGLDSTFSEFKKGVEKQIDVDDTESHYNLGIAYKEMGLLDDAILEFDQASRNPDRLLDCLTLKGVCQQEKGDRGGAEKTFKRGLENAQISEAGKISLLFELGLLYEADGKLLDALDCFQQVGDSDLFFRNVGRKIETLRQSLGLGNEEPEGNDSKSKGKKDRISYV
jgi:tetratricopeptide (TPR) repeat protein